MNIQIREAAADDFEYIYKLNRDEMGYDYPAEETRDKLIKLIGSDEHKLYVALAENKVVGYVHANDYNVIYAPHMKNIMGIAVAGEYKRMGVGRALLEKVEKWAVQTGARGIRLVSGSERTGVHLFYRSCGYTGDKRQINFKKYF